MGKLKTSIISTVRVAVAAIFGFLITWLGTANLLDAEIEAQLMAMIETVSVIVGTVAYYFVSRLLESRFPWLLGPRLPIDERTEVRCGD
jgi:Zn-dependent protease with chaperone function